MVGRTTAEEVEGSGRIGVLEWRNPCELHNAITRISNFFVFAVALQAEISYTHSSRGEVAEWLKAVVC